MSSKKSRPQPEQLKFETEVSQLLQLVIHSLYSNKEIFIRELISNASDACDKLRFAALDNDSLYEDQSELKITLDFDAKAKTITISDNGIGMTKDEVMENLGTIAKSGTKEFLAKITSSQAKDTNLIGQFGVGFYSAFIVADKVVVHSRKAGTSAGVSWESAGQDSYSVADIQKDTRGTTIVLHLKEQEQEFLNDYRLRSIVKKYSDHLCWPVQMLEVKQPSDNDEEIAAPEYETINKAKALWTLPKQSIAEEEYKEFYKHISHDASDPISWSHNKVEGKQEYTMLLYLPKNAPFDLSNREQQHGLHLYVQRVFIMDKAEQFLPNYLRFICGLIDSSDLPLNVSREILQSNALVQAIKAAVIKKSIAMISKLAKDKAAYQDFWRQFGLVLKEGIVEDFTHKNDLAKLLLLHTNKSKDEQDKINFAEYLERKHADQDKIYYLTANSFNAAKSSPHLELFNKKGIEVVLFTDRIDEWVVNHLAEVDGVKLQSIARGDIDDKVLADDQDEVVDGIAEEDLKYITETFEKVLSGRVKAIKPSKRLTVSPACLIADEGDMNREMLRILEAAGQAIPPTLPILEVNATHPLIKQINPNTDAAKVDDLVNLVFDQALLAEGGTLEQPGLFVSRLNKLLVADNL